VPEDVQYLTGQAERRTTRLYDRRQKKVTRNIVERISLWAIMESSLSSSRIAVINGTTYANRN
jgi:hypothetical protein